MAFFKGSYYENVPLFTPDDRGATVFEGLRARPLGRPEPVLEHSVAMKERLDSIAHHYYAESRDWRLIVESNPDVLFPEDLLFDATPLDENGRERLGHVILIPRRKEVR
jgi:hypothetical protein